MDEAAKYFANILWPLGPIILKKIEEVQRSGLEIAAIAPSHGLIWRSDISAIVSAYVSWSKQETKPKAVIVYETMWQSTALMARLIAEGLAAEGVSVKLYDINASDRTDVFKEMLDAKAFIVGSSTHDGSMLPAVAGFLHLLKGFKPKDRLGAAFGSFGWGGGAVREIEDLLRSAGLSMHAASLGVKYVPDEGERVACREFGRSIAHSIPGFTRV